MQTLLKVVGEYVDQTFICTLSDFMWDFKLKETVIAYHKLFITGYNWEKKSLCNYVVRMTLFFWSQEKKLPMCIIGLASFGTCKFILQQWHKVDLNASG